jgi:anti-sigma factor RsiW
MTCETCAELLNPYLDAELPLTDALEVERHLNGCADCRRQHEALSNLRQEIAAARLDYRPPRALQNRIERARSPRRPFAWALAAAAAAALVFVVLQPSGAEGDLIDGHLRSLAASHLVDVPSSDRHTVKPWFQGKTAFSPPVPDLSNDGFALLGGRLEVIRDQRVAVLVYKRREHVINVFAGQKLPAARRSEERGYHLSCWNDRGLDYCAVSDLNAAELAEFTKLFTTR